MQQAQKSFQQQQLNSTMLAAAMAARNNQIQMQQNSLQKPFNNNSVQNTSYRTEQNRKTPIGLNTNVPVNNKSTDYNYVNDKESIMLPYSNENFEPHISNLISNQPTIKSNSNESDSIKLKNLLEKINQVNLNTNQQVLANQLGEPHRKSPNIQKPQSTTENSIIHSILQSHAPLNSSPTILPKLPAMKVKTLEEIENELLNQTSSNQSTAPSTTTASNQSRISPSENHSEMKNIMNQNQARMNNQQQPNLADINKFFQLASNNINSSASLNDVNMNAEKQKKIYEAIALHHYQQQILKFQQHQQQQNGMLSSNQLDQQIQQLQILIQQQLISSKLNLNSLLPPNYPTLNQQQKLLILTQIQRNLQTTLLQQQLLQQQHQNGQMQRLEDQVVQQKSFNNDMNNNNHNDLTKPNYNINRSNNNNMNNMNNNIRQQHNNNNNNNNINNNNNNNNNNQNKDRRKQQQQQNNMRYNHNNSSSSNNNNNRNGDKLAGMMTDKEKNWVVNVQMLQLQIDDPYRYDYYYTAWMLKKKQFSMRQSNSSGLKTSVLYQLMNKQDPKNYRPLTFENSLGKVTMSNFHHPRALIDLNQRDHEHADSSSLVAHLIVGDDDDDEEKQKEVKNKDTILLEIEKIFEVLLSIDEIEHSILKAPEEMRILLFQERRAKVDRLAMMLCTENFAHYLFVEKGRRLLAKCIPTFNLAQTKLILGFFMQYIYIISKNNIALEEIYSHISYAIDTQKFTDLVEIVNQFVHLYSRQPSSIYHTIFSNKFSLTLLLKFVSKSELINQDDFDNDIKAIWSCYLNLVLVGLNLIQPISTKTDSATNIWNVIEINQLNIKTILENFTVNTELWSKNESKLKELFCLI